MPVHTGKKIAIVRKRQLGGSWAVADAEFVTAVRTTFAAMLCCCPPAPPASAGLWRARADRTRTARFPFGEPDAFDPTRHTGTAMEATS